jgi:hypothetical protein
MPLSEHTVKGEIITRSTVVILPSPRPMHHRSTPLLMKMSLGHPVLMKMEFWALLPSLLSRPVPLHTTLCTAWYKGTPAARGMKSNGAVAVRMVGRDAQPFIN